MLHRVNGLTFRCSSALAGHRSSSIRLLLGIDSLWLLSMVQLISD